MYAITLIIRGRADNDAIWLDEWFPKEGYGKQIHNVCSATDVSVLWLKWL